MNFKVSQSAHFLKLLSTLSDDEIELIGNFQVHLMSQGFEGLPGRNKPSTGVSKNHVNRIKLIQYAIANNLHHYHVGHTQYDRNKEFGDWTSEYVIHYQNHASKTQTINLVDYAAHPPFKLPSPNTLKP